MDDNGSGGGGDMSTAVSLPYWAVFDILSRTPVKSVCRFRCVSKAWRDLIYSPVFAAAHKARHGPLLVDTGTLQEEAALGGRDLRLMDMDGNVVRVIKGVGGFGMPCGTSLDDLICVNGASCDGISVVDPATGEVLLTCPQVDVVEHDEFPYVAIRYYYTFGLGRAVPSGRYKLVRLVADKTCSEVFTLGDGRGWRKVQPPPLQPRRHHDYDVSILHKVGSPVTVHGVMYFLTMEKYCNQCNLLCFDLESEQWEADLLEGPYEAVGTEKWAETTAVRMTELNGALCMIQSVCETFYRRNKEPIDPVTNLWILDNLGLRNWIKAYTIPMAPCACLYMPLRVMRGGRKLLLQCSFDEGRSLVLQIFYPETDTCMNITGAPTDLDGRIGLCNFHLDHPLPAKNLLALFLDQACCYFRN